MRFLGFLWQEYWGSLSFPPPGDRVLSELSTMTCPSPVALDNMAQSFIQLHKPPHHDKAVTGVLTWGLYLNTAVILKNRITKESIKYLELIEIKVLHVYLHGKNMKLDNTPQIHTQIYINDHLT